MGVEYNLVSRDAQRALEDFATEFTGALAQGSVETWAKDLGLHRVSRALKTTYPVPVSAAGYNEFKGDLKYRSLFEKSLELTPKTWQDGWAELASIVEAPDFCGFTGEPEAMAGAALSLPNEIIAELLERNPLCWDGQNFFDSDHPFNLFQVGLGTFSNVFTGPGTEPSFANISLAKQRFRAVKGPGGKPLGLRLTHILCPSTQEESFRSLLERDLIIEAAGDAAAAVDNRHKGTVKLVVSDELSDDQRWYPLALNKPGMYPWIVQDEGAPEEIRHDKSDAMYKQALKVGVAYLLRGNGALALPQCVQRWDGEPAEEG